MNRHPGGEETTCRLLRLAEVPAGARVLDLGAGAGESLRLLRALGYEAEGIDLRPRSELVREGDLLRAPYPDESFDAVLSECAFCVSGDKERAFRESLRLLRAGGALLYADVCFEPPEPLAERAGFRVDYSEDMTAAWREYYLEALWRGTAENCGLRGKCAYRLLVCRKEEKDGSV